ncbi:MAG: hypothetical protein ABEL76_14180 [Bradymonadaceae bacterium]
MTLVLVFITAALTLYALYRVAAPFLEERAAEGARVLEDELEEIEELAARKSVLMQSLRDIEFDRKTGKLSEEDYRRLKAHREREALEVAKKLEHRRGHLEYESEIDRQVKARLEQTDESAETDAPDRAPPSGDDAIECPECDRRLRPDAVFCSGCGERLATDPPDRAMPDDRAELETGEREG